MNTLKGFISLPVLANNLPGQTALFGELSTFARTFSRTQQNYADPDLYPGVELITFTTKTDTGSEFTPSVSVRGHILAVAKWVYDQHVSSQIPSNSSKAAFITSLVTEFPAMTSVVINEILNGSPSTKRMPDYIQWHYNDGGVDNLIKIWFCDDRFRSQYDDYEILVVPPVPTIDNLNNPTATVNVLLQQNGGFATVAAAVAVLRGTDPETYLIPFNVVWNDPNVPGATLNSNWTILVYGPSGNSNDNIKNAIREYISDHSSLTIWSTLYPSLYAENEYTIIPMWNDIASAESGLDPALFRSSIRVGKLITVSAALVPGSYAQAVNITTFLNTNLNINSAFFRSLTYTVVGNPNNAGSAFKFTDQFADYMDIPTDHADFARMSLDTQNFVIKLNDALEKAKALTSISAVPVGYSRVIHNGRVYLGFVYGAFTYIVLAQVSYHE